MVSALVSGSSGPGSSPGRGHCVVFLGKTLYSHNASLHPGVWATWLACRLYLINLASLIMTMSKGTVIKS